MADELQGLPFFILPHLDIYVYYSRSSGAPGRWAGGRYLAGLCVLDKLVFNFIKFLKINAQVALSSSDP